MARPLIIAHRGNSSAAPENTLSAFKSALALGVDGVELDYHHSADGVPVVFHDATLDRCTNAAALWRREKINLAEHTLVDLASLDYGSWFGDHQTFAKEPLATLEAAIDLICRAGALTVIERKSGDAATLVALLHRMARVNQVVVMAFDWPFLTDCHRLDPSLRLVALGEGPLAPSTLAEISTIPAGYVGWNQRDLNAAAIARIHQNHQQAWTWTVDSPDRMRELAAWEIDAITTNVLALALTAF